MVREMTLKRKPRESEGPSHEKIWGRTVPGDGNSRVKSWWV